MRHAWLILLLLPMAGAEAGIQNPDGPVPVALFMHLDGPQDIAMNAMAPPDGHEAQHAPSALGWSTCVATPAQGFTGAMHHTFYAFVSPVPTAYHEGVYPAPHRGILGDLVLPPQDLRLHFFLTQPRAPVSPEFVLHATLRQGDDISVNHAAMDAGSVIAEAQTQPATLSPLLQGHPDVTRHDDGVYEVVLKIPVPDGARVPQRESFNVRIDLWMEEPYCTDGYTMPDTVAIHTSPAYRPRLEMEVQDVLKIERLAVTLKDGALDFEALVRPVFGSADAILRSDALTIEGPVAPTSLSNMSWNGWTEPRAFPPPAVGGGGLRASQSWAFAQDAAAGAYTVRLEVATESGAVATAQVPFDLGKQVTTCSVLPTGEPTCALHGANEKKTPAVAPLLVLLGIALAARVRRP